MQEAAPRIPVLAAPTAAGKTAAAFAMALAVPLEVVSADAMQVYRGLDVGTAKPDAAQRTRLPHHVIDVVDPSEPYSVAAYVGHAEAAIADVLARGLVPLVVGGTGLYLRALAEGLPGTPPADRARQREIEAELALRGIDPLLHELARASQRDAERTARNPRRVVRAIEVLRTTGMPASAHARRPPRYRYRTAVALPDGPRLARRIRERSRRMIDAGWIDEVRALMPSMPGWSTAAQAIGYGEIRRHLLGEASLEETIEAIDRSTLRYAKRQRTWFRRTPSDALRLLGAAEMQTDALVAWLRSEPGTEPDPDAG